MDTNNYEYLKCFSCQLFSSWLCKQIYYKDNDTTEYLNKYNAIKKYFENNEYINIMDYRPWEL